MNRPTSVVPISVYESIHEVVVPMEKYEFGRWVLCRERGVNLGLSVVPLKRCEFKADVLSQNSWYELKGMSRRAETCSTSWTRRAVPNTSYES
jgi:hypothetical protein